MRISPRTQRIACRIAAARLARGLSLLPAYAAALRSMEEHHDDGPMAAFLHRVLEVVYPGDQMPAWVSALSSQRKNTWRGLVKMSRVLLGDLSHLKTETQQWYRQKVVKDVRELARPLRALEIMSDVADQEASFRHGPFRVFTVPGVSRKEVETALGAFDAAAAKVHPRFPQVLYGDVYLATSLAKTGPTSPSASYSPTSDTIHLSVRATRRFDDVYTIIHELGHRYGFKFAEGTPAYREFVDLSTRKVWESVIFDAALRNRVADEVAGAAEDRRQGRPVRTLSEEAVLWAKQPHVEVKARIAAFLSGKIDGAELRDLLRGHGDVEVETGKLLHGPLAVTPYGATKVTENFAEAFAHYVLGMPLAPELRAVLESMA